MKKSIGFIELIIVLSVIVLIAKGLTYKNSMKHVSPSVNGNKSNISIPVFIIKTVKGTMKGELYPDSAPNTVLNFVTLSKAGFYNGLTFHRVVKDFVIQGGDPNGDGTGGPGYNIPAEFNKREHQPGTLAMARASEPDSGGSQFYICITRETCKHLDGKYTVFGQVTEGLDVISKIEQGDKIEEIMIIGDLPKELQGKEITKVIDK